MKSFLAAVSFLSIIPLGTVKQYLSGKDEKYSAGQMKDSMGYYPFVGVILGICYSAIYLLSAVLFSHLAACALVLGSMVILTGGLHLDGVADTCDGLAGGRDKENILRIAKDSATGVAGVLGLIVIMLIKFSLLVSLAPEVVPYALVLSTTLARWSLVAACRLYPYARSKEGTARVFVGRIKNKQMVRATLVAIIVSLFICKFQAVTVWPWLLLFFWGFNSYIVKKIDGITGDTLGALSEFSEVLVLLLAAGFLYD